MKFKLTTVYVDDEDKALRFYTEVSGFQKKANVCNGPLPVAQCDFTGRTRTACT